MSTKVDKSLPSQLEILGFTRQEVIVLLALLRVDDPRSINELIDEAPLPRHQIYRALVRLVSDDFVEEIGGKPKRYFTDQTVLKETVASMEQEMVTKVDWLNKTSDDEALEFLGVTNDKLAVYEEVRRNPCSRKELEEKLDLGYEKVRSLTGFLTSRGFLRKVKQSKTIMYHAVPIDEIRRQQVLEWRNDLEEKQSRIKDLLDTLAGSEVVGETPSVLEPHQFLPTNQVMSVVAQKAKKSGELFSTLFIASDNSSDLWGQLLLSEINGAIDLVKNGVQVLWLVSSPFIKLFDELPMKIVEEVLKDQPLFKIRVYDSIVERFILVNDSEFFHFSFTKEFLGHAIYHSDKGVASLKNDEFMTVWSKAQSFEPLLYENSRRPEIANLLKTFSGFSEVLNFNIALVGDKGVGKTSLVRRLATDRFEHYQRSTLGIMVDDVIIQLPQRSSEQEPQIARLTLFDFAGQELFKSNYPAQLVHQDAIGLVFDLNDGKSLEGLTSWAELVPKETSMVQFFFLVGTKQDLDDSRPSEDQVWDRRKKYRCDIYYPTSALKGTNVRKLFEDVAEKLFLLKKNSSGQ